MFNSTKYRILRILGCNIYDEKTVHCETLLSDMRCEICGNIKCSALEVIIGAVTT